VALTYNPTARKWDVGHEKIDYDTSRPTNLPVLDKMGAWFKYETSTVYNKGQKREVRTLKNVKFGPSAPGGEGWEYKGEVPVDYKKSDLQKIVDKNFGAAIVPSLVAEKAQEASSSIQQTNKENKQKNEENQKLNNDYAALNEANKKLNSAYDHVISVASTTKGGDYVSQRDSIANLQTVDQNTKNALVDNFKNFYRTEKLQPWNSALGAKPQYGEFDAKYYAEQNPNLKEAWNKAVNNDDIDITERYSQNSFYLQHYTNQGKAAGLRGNAPETTTAALQYVERKPTDQDLQAVRNLQLGIDTGTQTDRLLNIPEIAAEWEKAKNGDAYWKQLAKDKYLDINEKDEFAALFRLSDRPEDKQVSLNYNVNAGYGVTQLEDALNQAVGEKATVDVKRFGALSQNVLKDTIEEMKKAKLKEQELGMMRGLSGFSEIMDINKELANSILGDSGVGGMLSFMSPGNQQESLEKSLQNITGINNNVTYNWQQWFDSQLKEKYNKEIELGYPGDEAKEQIKIDAGFARDFIDKYLVPRFNTSRSMDEFVEYLDVRQEEQNPFQTQLLVDAVSQVANLRANQYLDQIKNTGERYFDSNFYFNPTGDKAREAAYADQAKTVAADWEAAKKGDPYWQQQAYRFGVDLNDKAAFARMHFQVKGQGKGYDAADDILNAGKVQDQIYNNILPALKEETLKQGSVFGQFLTPEEFTNALLEGVDPSKTEAWNEILQRYGMEDFKGNVEELKGQIQEALRTGSAQQIREEIKYLNEKRERPTQQVLGITYIERPEDYKQQQIKGETELYKTFQAAGYQGTEDEFYTKFFPDTDRSEQLFLTKAGTGTNLQMLNIDTKDPFASLSSLEGFFDQEDTSGDSQDTPAQKSFFNLGLEDDESDYKSKTGSQILGEFTSMFKGF